MKSLLLAFCLFAVAAAGAPIERDLGLGLRYDRVHEVASDLPAEAPAHRATPWVLDVRYVQGDAADGTSLFAWLKAHAGLKTPVFLLVNDETASAVLAPLSSLQAVPGVVVLGTGAPDFLPDIVLSVPPETERQAYDALEHGAAIGTLVSPATDKPRNDEAKLVKEHLADGSLDDDDVEPSAASKPVPLFDPVLQRAVQLHRALLALHRL